MNYKVIDNFLDEKYFDSLVSLLEEIPWFFQKDIAYDNVAEDNLFYMIHEFYGKHQPLSSSYEKLFPLLEKLEVRCLLRVKANLFPHTEKLYEHQMHEDDNFSHSGGLLSLNTCDGYTKLEDGTKINSVANRILLFDSSKKHC